MSLAAAIAEATGLSPETDFQVVVDKGSTTINWDTAKLGPMPDQAQLDQYVADYQAKQPDRDKSQFITSIFKEYVNAMIANDLFQDSKPLDALITKVEQFKMSKP